MRKERIRSFPRKTLILPSINLQFKTKKRNYSRNTFITTHETQKLIRIIRQNWQIKFEITPNFPSNEVGNHKNSCYSMRKERIRSFHQKTLILPSINPQFKTKKGNYSRNTFITSHETQKLIRIIRQKLINQLENWTIQSSK